MSEIIYDLGLYKQTWVVTFASLKYAFLVTFFSTFIACLFFIITDRFHRKISHDNDLSGAQKFHKLPVPRIGGLSLVIGLIIASILIGMTR